MVRVFVVEDSALLRQELVLTTPWAQLGCEVAGESGNGREAEAMIRACKPDLVITDICIPQMDGLEMIEALKDLPDIRYIIISAYSKFEYAMKAIKLQVSDYVLKPIDDRELYATIERAVSCRPDPSQSPQPASEPPAELPGSRHIAALMKYVQQQYAREISLAEIAKAHYISESYVSKLFRRELNTSFAEYVTFVRIQQAVKLLQPPSKRLVSQVAQMVGFNDYRYFCATFKKLVGIPPKQYQIKATDKGAK